MNTLESPVDPPAQEPLDLALLGPRAAAARRDQGLSQAELARRAGWTRNTLSFFEQGRPRGDIGYRKITRLLKVLGLTLALAQAGPRRTRPNAEELIARRNRLRGFDAPQAKSRARRSAR